MSTTDKKLELIAQLLAKAERTTPAEAEALTEHASRLMVKYGIEQARIDERRAREGKASEQIVEARVSYAGTYSTEQRQIGAEVAFALGTLRPLQSKTWDGDHILHLVGFESDVEQAKVLLDSLQVQAAVAMRAWWKQNRVLYEHETEHRRRRARLGFLRGFGLGAAARIAASRQSEVVEAGNGTELVLASRKSRVDALVDSQGLPTARPSGKTDTYGLRNGYEAGQNANTGERAVDRGRGLPAGSLA